MNIYLAGGFHTGWQDIVMEDTGGHTFYNPSKDSRQLCSYQFTSDDIEAIDRCDLVFAYFEESNPSGIGLAIEVGYALGKGKKVILVDTHQRIDSMLACCVSKLYTDLETAILKSL